MAEIDNSLYNELKRVRIITDGLDDIRDDNVGFSNYSSHIIQPWSIWIDWNLNPWDADIIKRVLRTKSNTSRKEDYEKIIHICKERIAQLNYEINKNDF